MYRWSRLQVEAAMRKRLMLRRSGGCCSATLSSNQLSRQDCNTAGKRELLPAAACPLPASMASREQDEKAIDRVSGCGRMGDDSMLSQDRRKASRILRLINYNNPCSYKIGHALQEPSKFPSIQGSHENNTHPIKTTHPPVSQYFKVRGNTTGRVESKLYVAFLGSLRR